MKRNTLAAIALLVLFAFCSLVIIYPMIFNSVKDLAPESFTEAKVPPRAPPSPRMTN